MKLDDIIADAFVPMPEPVVEPGEFCFAVSGMDHGHIYGQTAGLIKAGATLKYVHCDTDPDKAAKLAAENGAQHVTDLGTILNDDDVKLVASACIPDQRAALGVRCMEAGKDYFVDKGPLTTLKQLDAVWEAVKNTGRKYMVYYSERLDSEAGIYLGRLIERGAIGRVIQVTGFGPHRIGDPKSRPDWFYQLEKYGGILCDIGSHQIEQFLQYSGAKDARVLHAKVANYNHPDYPELQDFGDCTLVGDNGATMYFRLDWFTPDGLGTWGDGRTFVIGTEGYIEARKYTNIADEGKGDHVFIVNGEGERRIDVKGKVGKPYFGQLIRDCIDRTETAMTQQHALKVAELCVKAQLAAEWVEGGA